MGKITENLGKVEKAMKDPTKKAGLSLLLKNAAIDAIMAGIGSPQWETYMSMFADNKQQLDRLTVVNQNDEPWLRASRAYIVSNAVCAPDTNTATGNGVFKAEIDKDLSDAADAVDVVKKLRPKDFDKFVK